MNQPPRRTLRQVLCPRRTYDNFWDELCTRIRDGTVIPIVSSSVHADYVLAPLIARLQSHDAPNAPSVAFQATPGRLTVDEELADAWAASLGYPLIEHPTLAQVAQYNRVKSSDNEQAHRRYLTFLKKTVLDLVEQADPERADLVQEQRQQMNEHRYSDMVASLDLPDGTADDDPLRLLARLNLPIYLTTSYDDFLERAIQSEGRPQVSTQVCGCSRGNPAYRVDRDFEPCREQPVVYHLLGVEDDPASLVLSEDDYLDFLVRVTRPVDPESPEIPLYLHQRLAESTLLLLGYRLQDWDFRATFFGLIKAKEAPRRRFSVAIQLSPREQRNATDPDEAEAYLTDYFKLVNFHVEWSDSAQFMRTLWQHWNQWRGGSL